MVGSRLSRRLTASAACLWLLALIAHAVSPEEMQARLEKTRRQYSLLSSNYQANPSDPAAAWKFSEACFDLAEFATNDTQRATLAHQGIAAGRQAIEGDPEHPGGYFYLALNLGQLARTRSFSALGIIREMERTLLMSIEKNNSFDNTGAHRSLGMLYVEAPGWPVSIGSRSKARKHLERALELAPLYPDNHLTALETWIRWKDRQRLRKGLDQYRKIMREAREKYTGEVYVWKWQDWDERWAAIQKQAAEILDP